MAKEEKNVKDASVGEIGNGKLLGVVDGVLKQVETDKSGGLMTFDKGVSKSDINIEGGVTGFNPIGEVAEGDKRAVSGGEVFLNTNLLDKSLSSISYRKNLFNPINLLSDTLINQDGNTLTLIENEGSISAFMKLDDGVNDYKITPYPINTSGRRCGLFNSLNLGSEGYNLSNNNFTTNNDNYVVFGLKFGVGGIYLNPNDVMIQKGHDDIPFSRYTDLNVNTISKIENSDKPINSFAIIPFLTEILSTNIFNPVNILNNTLISQTGNTIELISNAGSITAFCEIKEEYYKVLGHPINSSGRRSGFVDSLNIGSKGINNSTNIFKSDKKYFVFGLKWGVDGVYLDPNDVSVINDINQNSFIKYGDYVEKISIDNNKTSSLMVGASFAFDGNVWYKKAYDRLKTYNKNLADGSGVSMTNFVQHIYNGDLYTPTTLDDFNHLVIYLSHNVNVADGLNLRDTAQDYEPITGDHYSNSQNWDYFLKKYYDDCYKQKDNPNSKYYQSKAGKPVSIIVFTHWHDGRKIFNDSIRVLRDKWGFSLIELDKEIGFKMSTPMPTTNEQCSVNYAVDTENINIDGESIEFGWHPIREGNVLYVQERTENIFVDFIRKL